MERNKTNFLSFLHALVLHTAECLSARCEPTQVNNLLSDGRPSLDSKMAVLVGEIAWSAFASWCPAFSRPPVHWREGEGNPPGQEQSSLREVWFRAGSTEQDGESSGGSEGTGYSIARRREVK